MITGKFKQRLLYSTAVINYSRPVNKKSLIDIAYPKIRYILWSAAAVMINRLTKWQILPAVWNNWAFADYNISAEYILCKSPVNVK